MPKFVTALLTSRKFWLSAIAIGAAAATGQAWMIPWVLMGNASLIAGEDVASKLRKGGE